MKRKIEKVLFLIIFMLLSHVTFVNAETKYEIKEIPEISKYNPEFFWEPENGKMTFYGEEYDCETLDGPCNMYSYDFNGNVIKLNKWGGFGDATYPYDALSIKEKQGDDYLVETCHFDSDGKKVECKTIENLKVKKLIHAMIGIYILEIYNVEEQATRYLIYDGSGNEILKLSADLELIISYEKITDSSFSEAEFANKTYVGNVNILFFKNTKTNNYHVVGYNGKEEIITLDALKTYGLTEKNVLDLEISLSDEKNIYHVGSKVFGDSNGVFSSKQYSNAYASKLGDTYVIVDIVKSNTSGFKDDYYNNWYSHINVYDTSGNALVTENEYVFVNESIMSEGILVMYNQKGEVIVRDNKSVLLEKDLGLKELTDDFSNSVIYEKNLYFILTTPDEYGNPGKSYAYVLEIRKEETNGDKNGTLKELTYKFISGFNETFKIDSKNNVTFIIDGDFKLFKEIYIDDKLLDSKNYTVKEGSTVITLNNDYSRKLSDKKEHTIKVVYTNDKEVSTTFKVEEKIDNPHTGQAISILFIFVLIGIAAFLKKAKKEDVLKKI